MKNKETFPKVKKQTLPQKWGLNHKSIKCLYFSLEFTKKFWNIGQNEETFRRIQKYIYIYHSLFWQFVPVFALMFIGAKGIIFTPTKSTESNLSLEIKPNLFNQLYQTILVKVKVGLWFIQLIRFEQLPNRNV